MIATELKGPLTFTITSKVNFDYAIIDTCHREILVKMPKRTNSLTYKIDFLPVELTCKSAIVIQMFAENKQTDWALIAIRTHETLQTNTFGVECNGVRWTFKGYTVCNPKKGKKQIIAFDVPIKDFRSRGECGLTRLDELKFEVRPLSECTMLFRDHQDRWHTALFLPYKREFVQ